MQIRIVTKNFKLTEAIENTVEGKIGSLQKYFKNEVEAVVTLSVGKSGHKIEVIIFDKGRQLKSECENDNLYTAIDIIVDKLKVQISKFAHKGNKLDLKSIRVADLYSDDDEEEDEIPSKIKRRKNIENKPMNEEEAILQMELLGHQTFMFLNSDTDRVAMLYKRKQGDFGILEMV